jgi:hypothetical protein
MPKLMTKIKSSGFYTSEIEALDKQIISNNNLLNIDIKKLYEKHICKSDMKDIEINYIESVCGGGGSMEIVFFSDTKFKLRLQYCEILYIIDELHSLNNEKGLEHFNSFNNQYEIFKKYIKIVTDNENDFFTTINHYTSCKKENIKIMEKIEINKKLLERSNNKKNLFKIMKVFPLNKINNFNDYILETFFKKNTIFYLLALSGKTKIRFVTYYFEEKTVLFEENCIDLLNYGKEDQKIMYQDNEITNEEAIKIFENTFSISDEFVENIKTISDFLNVNYYIQESTITISYDEIIDKINPELIKLNIKDFK